MRTHLDQLESESIGIIRDTMGSFRNPVVLYSVGKDSSVLLHLVVKACLPAHPQMPLLHIDTGYKFPDMLAFRDRRATELGFTLLVHRNEQAIAAGVNPHRDGIAACCGQLKTEALLQALAEHGFDAAIGGARRDEEASRAKERIFSFRNRLGQWDPRGQRPELGMHYNTRLKDGESMRVFPLSNWTETDIWSYIQREAIEIVPLYFAKERPVRAVQGQLIPVLETNTSAQMQCVRYRTLGCHHCTAATPSSAATLEDIISETQQARQSERSTRLIDHGASSMEDKKREGYF
jgi:sulfate adenylyltransferase subunit 2